MSDYRSGRQAGVVMSGRMVDSRGFTLIEAVIVLCIIAIMALIALPSLKAYIDNSNLRTAANDLASSFYLSKEKATAGFTVYQTTFTSGGSGSYTVSKCSSSGTSCSSSFSDISATDFSAFGSEIKLTASPSDNPVIFYPRGITNITAAAGDNIILTNNRGSTATITVFLTGRTNVTWDLK
jgi:type IV fimbrial biogenesis protein FimT